MNKQILQSGIGIAQARPSPSGDQARAAMFDPGLQAGLLGTVATDREPDYQRYYGGPAAEVALRAVVARVVDRSPLIHHLNQVELSRRWRISSRTLEQWRWIHRGPPYLKIGGRVVYRLEDVEAFEAQQMRGSVG